jgi:hypothetical protein
MSLHCLPVGQIIIYLLSSLFYRVEAARPLFFWPSALPSASGLANGISTTGAGGPVRIFPWGQGEYAVEFSVKSGQTFFPGEVLDFPISSKVLSRVLIQCASGTLTECPCDHSIRTLYVRPEYSPTKRFVSTTFCHLSQSLIGGGHIVTCYGTSTFFYLEFDVSIGCFVYLDVTLNFKCCVGALRVNSQGRPRRPQTVFAEALASQEGLPWFFLSLQ